MDARRGDSANQRASWSDSVQLCSVSRDSRASADDLANSSILGSPKYSKSILRPSDGGDPQQARGRFQPLLRRPASLAQKSAAVERVEHARLRSFDLQPLRLMLVRKVSHRPEEFHLPGIVLHAD